MSACASSPSELDLGALYRAHASRVAGWVRKLGGAESEVDDLVHEVFLIAERRLDEFRGEARVTTWLYRITERVVLAHRRRARRPTPETMFSIVSTGSAPDEELEHAELRGAVQDTLQSLAPVHRQVLELGVLGERSAREVAEALAVSETAVWVRAHRAKKVFKERFSKRHPSLIPFVAFLFAVLLLSAGASAIAHWVRAQSVKLGPARPPAPESKPPSTTHVRPFVPPKETIMRKKPLALALTAALATVPVAASAEEPPPESVEIVPAKVTRIDFSELRLTGHVEGPEGSFVYVRPGSRFACLVRVRGDFVPELLSSVDGL